MINDARSIAGTSDHSAAKAAYQLMNMANAVAAPLSKKKANRGLYISMHGSTNGNLGKSILRHAGCDESNESLLCVEGHSHAVRWHCRNLLEKGDTFDEAVAAYELHEDDRPWETVELLRKLTPRGIVLVADYVMRGLTKEQVQQFGQSKAERLQQDEKGLNAWIFAHTRHTPTDLENWMYEAGFLNVISSPLAGYREFVAGSDWHDVSLPKAG